MFLIIAILYILWISVFKLHLLQNNNFSMKQCLVAVLFLFLFPVLIYAQHGDGYSRGREHGQPETNVISVFSDNGEYFYVILNGIKQNIEPHKNIRIEGIVNPINEIQILFTDNVTREIQKKITVANPVDNSPVNLTLRIIRERDGDAKLRFYSCIPKEPDYQPAQGEYVMYYGHDVERERHHDHDRDYGNNQGGSVGITPVYSTPPPPPPPPAGPLPMDIQSFGAAKQAVKSSSFDETKLSTAKTIAGTNFFTTDQVVELCNLFSFEQTKLDFAKYAFKRTIDNSNYFKINSVFSFDATKQELNDYVSKNR